MDSKTGPRQLAAELKGGLVAAQEARDHQHRLAVERPARSALAEGAEHPPEVPGDLAPIAVLGRGIVAFPLLRRLGTLQRNSRPISCCIDFGSRTRPSAV